MDTYRYIQIHDDSCPDDDRMEDFIDLMDIRSRAELLSAFQHGGCVTLRWRGETPAPWNKPSAELVFRDDSIDYWMICNEPYGK